MNNVPHRSICMMMSVVFLLLLIPLLGAAPKGEDPLPFHEPTLIMAKPAPQGSVEIGFTILPPKPGMPYKGTKSGKVHPFVNLDIHLKSGCDIVPFTAAPAYGETYLLIPYSYIAEITGLTIEQVSKMKLGFLVGYDPKYPEKQTWIPIEDFKMVALQESPGPYFLLKIFGWPLEDLVIACW
jgi:hypothetical protein